MSSDISLQGLIDLARLYADQRPGGSSAFVPDTGSGSVQTLVNLALAELYDLLVDAGGHEYYVKDSPLSIVAATASYALPSDFYRVVTVHLEWQSNDHEYVPDFAQAERFRLTNFVTWGRRTPKGYRIRGAQTTAADQESVIEFYPTPSLAVTGRIRYIPAFTPLTDVANHFFSTVNGWERVVAYKVAAELAAVEKDWDTNARLLAMFEAEKQRIQGIADMRSEGAVPQIVDVDAYRSVPEWAADRRWI